MFIGSTLLYFDLRARTEGFDLALQTAAPETLTPPLAKEPLLTRRDMLNFAILSAGIVGLYIVVYLGTLAIFFAIIGSVAGRGP